MYVGCAIYVIGEDIRFDLEGMHDYFEQEGITNVFMTTQVGTQMAINYPDIKGMKVLVTGGEKLMSINPPRSYKLLNAYGPTETTVYVTTYEVTKKEPGAVFCTRAEQLEVIKSTHPEIVESYESMYLEE